MKKTLTKLLSMMLVFASFCGMSVTASAATLEMSDTGIWWERAAADGSNHKSWHLFNYYIDGDVAYCIEPGTEEGNPIYETSWEGVGLPNSIKERMQLIGYYGYTYPGHGTAGYRAATSAMLWKEIMGPGSWVTFNTARYSAGANYDCSSEEAEINRLVSRHYVKPSFNGGVFNIQVGQPYQLNDTNGVLGDYNVSVNNAEYSVNGNTLNIKTTDSGTLDMSLSKKMYYSHGFRFFAGDTKQNMMIPGTVDPVLAAARIKSYYSTIEIVKSDSETGTAQGQATLQGAVYGVYNKATNELITKITTDETGYGKSEAIFPYGEYYVRELSASEGYYVDETVYDVDLRGVENVKVDVTEQIVKNKISILKQYEYVDGNSTFLNAEANIQFEISYPDGTLYGGVITDEHGYAEIDLPYGVWTFHQVNSTPNFEKIQDFNITVNYDTPLMHYYNILNNEIAAYLHIEKIDCETGEAIALADTTFKILNTDTNEYVSQFVGGKTYTEFKTDEEGYCTTYLKLKAGNYKLFEVKTPYGYLKAADGLSFSIGDESPFEWNEHGAFLNVKFANRPTKGKVVIHKDGEEFTVATLTAIPTDADTVEEERITENTSYFTYEKINLEGAVFGVFAEEDIKSPDGRFTYYAKEVRVATLVTDADGNAESKSLPLGKYYLKEIEAPEKYRIDENIYHIELVYEDDETPVVYSRHNLENQLKKGALEFSKLDLVDGEEVPDCVMEIYTENDELIFTGITDENGKIIIPDLQMGKYYIVETDAAEGYLLSDEIVYFEIIEDGKVVKAEMTNKPITGNVEFTKLDVSTSQPLPNTTMELYTENDVLIFSGVTDSEGKLVFENLRYGRYYFVEKNAPAGYKLNNNKMYFEIREDGVTVKCTMTDERIPVEIPVPDTGMHDTHISEIIAAVLIAAGTGVIIYDKKRKNK